MNPAQLYETTICNRDDGRACWFISVPARSILTLELAPAGLIADRLGLEPIGPTSVVEPVEAWSLPFMIDGLMGRWTGPQRFREWRFYFDVPNRRGPSQFAQHVAFAKVIPFKSSPLGAVALAELIVRGDVSAALGYLGGHPVLLFEAAGAIIVCGAATGIGDGLRIGLRTMLLRLMGVETDHPEDGDSSAGSDEPEDTDQPDDA